MKIKKGWKITWITLGSLVGLVVVLVAVAMWLIFTPSKLTKIVNSLAGNYITCEARFGSVDLTLLSTFPDAGLRIENVVVVNPMEGAGSDTMARIGSLTVGIDVMAFLKENKVIVHQVRLDDAEAGLYINREGRANFDIFPKSKEDTSSTALPEVIDLKKIKVKNLNARFRDEKDGMNAETRGMDMALKGSMKGKDVDGEFEMEAGRVVFAMLDSMGVAKMNADVEGVKLEAEGSMKGEAIDAELRVDGQKVAYGMCDSTGSPSLQTLLNDIVLKLEGKGTTEELAGDLKLKVESGNLEYGGMEMVNENLQVSKRDLLTVELPNVEMKKNGEGWKVLIGEDSRMRLDEYALMLAGEVDLAQRSEPLSMDVKVNTDGKWQVKPLLDIMPEQFVSFRKGMDLDGQVSFALTAVGTVTDSTMPAVTGTVQLDKGLFYAPKMLPYKLEKVKGRLTTGFYMDKSKESWVKLESLNAHTRGSDLAVSGRVEDLMGDMRVAAKVKGTLPLEDVEPMIPKGIDFSAKGDADLDLSVQFKMSQLQKQAFDKMKATGMMKLKDVKVNYDTIHASTPWMDIALQMPSNGKMADVQVKSGKLKVERGTMNMNLEDATVNVGVNNVMKEQLAAAYDIKVGETEVHLDSMVASMSELNLKGTLRMDSTQKNVVQQYNPRFGVETHNVLVYTPKLPETVHLSEFEMRYTGESCRVESAKVRVGHSDFELYGEVENVEDWLEGKSMLKGDLNLTSEYADVDQMMKMVSGMGSDKDSLELMRKKDGVPEEANPFIVPKNVDVTLHTHIKRSIAFGNDLHDVAGSLTIKDGRAILDQMGFVCKAATMQLTALYKSQRPGHLYAGIDFHLLDIQIDELLDMIPAVDTLVPMLKAFNGNANFHFAGESFMDANYQLKLPTVKGAAAISGKDLVFMDNSDIATIAKFMRFKSWKDKDNKIKVDSLTVEMTCMDMGYGTEVEVLPFLLCMGSYKICVSGVQQFNKDCSYHIELLKNPLLAKVAVDVKGSLLKPKISLGKVKYADLFKPKYYGVAEEHAMRMKNAARKELEANVR